MSERKVINKYIPPNFDPNRIPRRKERPTQHTVRLMAPFSMRCNSCGEFIYKGRKFNARKETVQGERYLGIRIFRFYIRCPVCAAEITYRTDPKTADYACESGAKRNFEPWREERAEEERAKTRKLLEELHNPMSALENRTYDAKREAEMAETLDEIRLRNSRLEEVDTDVLFERVVREMHGGSEESGPSLTGRASTEEDDQIVREAFKKAAQRAEETAPPKLNVKDLLITGGGGGEGRMERMNGQKLTPASLGIVPRKRKS